MRLIAIGSLKPRQVRKTLTLRRKRRRPALRRTRSKVMLGAIKSWHTDVSKPSVTPSNTPSFSVIVPTCGRVSLFTETLDSLAQQTYRDFEVVVSDDSPQEEDRRFIRHAVEKFTLSSGHRAKYVHSAPRLGQAVNTNQGLSAASGDLLRILHSDDLLRGDALECEAALFARRAAGRCAYSRTAFRLPKK